MQGLVLQDVHIAVNGNEIVKGVSMVVKKGEIVGLLGTNGAGKSTLAYAIMGHPRYVITKGKIMLDNQDITVLPPHERSKLGLFLGFQNPPEIEGVKVSNLLKMVSSKMNSQFSPIQILSELKLSTSFLARDVNVNFSGGERKRFEIARLIATNPKIAILDEPDSGVDVDSLNLIANVIRRLKESGTGFLIITHYRRILQPLQPDRIYVMHAGNIVAEGGCELVRAIESKGYGAVIKNVKSNSK
ncbi:MAG: Fe-S cluster assembly ATPase SufC [Candidatus Asgardarchaeia archaeon]